MQGRIIKWDDEKGFGFIQSPEVTENIFVHASSFVDKRIRPAIGDDIAFELKRTDKGLQAKKVDYPNKSEQFLSAPRSPNRQANVRSSNSSIIPSLIKLILLCGVLFGGYQFYQKYQANKDLNELAQPMYAESSAPIDAKSMSHNTPSFTCDGRQHCSQMNSREEAEFFIKNCPATKMDGDNDGIPCEGDSRW